MSARTELEFLPAAVEIQETPPAPLGRAVLWTIVVFFVALLAWSFLGRSDVVAVARGKVIPAGRIKSVQPLEIGQVRAIHVAEGQAVKAGALLVELDPTTVEADRVRLESERDAVATELRRVQALLGAADAAAADPLPYLAASDLPAEALRVQQSLLASEYTEFQARREALERTIGARAAEKRVTETRLRKLEAILPLVEARTDALEALAAHRFVAQVEYLRLEEQRLDHAHEAQALREERDALSHAMAKAEADLQALHAEFRASRLREVGRLETRVAVLGQDLVKANGRAGSQRLHAPVGGVVQQLAVHTVGGVVTPAQILMRIVPENDVLEVEAFIENKDIGFVWDGQQTEVKVDAFPFTKYGTVAGTIVHVSGDAVPNDAGGWVFPARVALQRSRLVIEGREVDLVPGMATTTEIKLGERRIIEFFLEPLLRHLKEGARER